MGNDIHGVLPAHGQRIVRGTVIDDKNLRARQSRAYLCQERWQFLCLVASRKDDCYGFLHLRAGNLRWALPALARSTRRRDCNHRPLRGVKEALLSIDLYRIAAERVESTRQRQLRACALELGHRHE